jgi:hypothetical protein
MLRRGRHRCGGEGNTDVDEREIKMLWRGIQMWRRGR